MPVLSLKRLLLCFCLCVNNLPGLAAEMPGPDDILIASSLIASTGSPSPGSTTTLAILMEPQGEWHGYWKQPGDVGLPATFTWHLPDAVTVGAPAYPLPQMLLIEGLMNHVYEHPYALLVDLTLDDDLPDGTPLPIRVDMQYLACRYDACVPEHASLETTLHVGDVTSCRTLQPVSPVGARRCPGRWLRRPVLTWRVISYTCACPFRPAYRSRTRICFLRPGVRSTTLPRNASSAAAMS